MNVPLKLTVHGMASTQSIEAHVERKAAKLARFSSKVSSCHVTIDGPHKHHHKGNQWAVRIDLTLPGQEIVISRSPTGDHSHEDLHVTIDDAFETAYRRLDEHAESLREARRP